MHQYRPTMTTTPKYQKIPGEKLTADQFTEVHLALEPKFGAVMPKDTLGKVYFFDGNRFLNVFADAA